MLLRDLGLAAASGIVALALGGCGAEAATSQGPALTAYSGGSAASGSASMGSGSSGSAEVRFGSASGQSGSGISVRPDLVEVPFAVAAVGPAPIDVVQAEVAKLAARVGESAGSAPRVQLKSLNLTKPTPGNAKDENERKATAEGCLVFNVAPEADYWARAKLLDGIVRASGRFTAEVATAKDEKARSRVLATIGAPLLKVKDAEAHRAALTKRVVEQSRAFIAEIDPQGKLALEDCAMPQPVQQSVVGPEEIVLSLSIACKVQARGEHRTMDR